MQNAVNPYKRKENLKIKAWFVNTKTSISIKISGMSMWDTVTAASTGLQNLVQRGLLTEDKQEQARCNTIMDNNNDTITGL